MLCLATIMSAVLMRSNCGPLVPVTSGIATSIFDGACSAGRGDSHAAANAMIARITAGIWRFGVKTDTRSPSDAFTS